MAADVPAFPDALAAANRAAIEHIAELSRASEPAEGITVRQLLRLALKNELEAAELAARWLGTTDELDVKLAYARQCGDEAKHYKLIEGRLKALGDDLGDFDPQSGGYSPLFQYLSGLAGTVERLAAGPYTREALALVRNEAFIEFCEAQGDLETAALYQDVVQPDERHHHDLGDRLLRRYATTPESQAAAREAAARTLQLAEELQEIARMKAGISRAPGC